jgi:hypothetical protein
MYVGLAYGIQAFHFWPPRFVQCKMDADRNAVLEDGKPVFSLSEPAKTVSQVALEMKALSPTMINLTSDAVYHTDAAPPIGANKAPADLWFQPEGETFLVGVFHNAEKQRFLMPVNHGIDRERELTLRFREKLGLELCDRTTGEWRALELQADGDQQVLKLTLAAGDGELLRVVEVK